MDRRAGGNYEAWFDGTKSPYAYLREAFALFPAPGNPADRRGAMTREERAAWRDLQAEAPAGSVADGDIACLLAHVGVDYALNVRRLLRGRTIADHALHGHGNQPGHARRYVPGHVASLYDKWRDQDLLDWLLDATPRGEAEQTAWNQAILALWDTHRLQMLRTAATDDQRCRRISDALRYAELRCADPVPWLVYQCQLYDAAIGRDTDARNAAHAILFQLGLHETSIPVAYPDSVTGAERYTPPTSRASNPRQGGPKAGQRFIRSGRRLQRNPLSAHQPINPPRRFASGRQSPPRPAAQGE